MSAECPICKVVVPFDPSITYTDVNGDLAEFNIRCLRCNQVMIRKESEKVQV